MNRIKEIRQEKKLSQKDLAKKLNISQQAISLYEKGDREPKLETWQKLADFFGVSVPYLQGLSYIKDLDRVSTFEKFYESLETTPDGKSVKVPIDEALALSNGLQIKEFLTINDAILNGQNEHLSINDLENYKKITANFDAENLADIDEINFNITQLYLIMLNAIQGKKKDKKALSKINKIIEIYLGLDEEDKWDGLPITLKKQRSENKEE